MEDEIIKLGIIEIKFLEGETRFDELPAIRESEWRLPKESEIEYIANLYINYDVLGKAGWYWTDTYWVYEISTNSRFKPDIYDTDLANTSAGVLLVRDI